MKYVKYNGHVYIVEEEHGGAVLSRRCVRSRDNNPCKRNHRILYLSDCDKYVRRDA
jgi:hypothetical protein